MMVSTQNVSQQLRVNSSDIVRVNDFVIRTMYVYYAYAYYIFEMYLLPAYRGGMEEIFSHFLQLGLPDHSFYLTLKIIR